LLCEQIKAAYPTDMMIELMGRGFAPVAAVLSFIAEDGPLKWTPNLGSASNERSAVRNSSSAGRPC